MQGDSQSHNFIFSYVLEIYAYHHRAVTFNEKYKIKWYEKVNKFQLANVCMRSVYLYHSQNNKSKSILLQKSKLELSLRLSDEKKNLVEICM